MELSAVIQLTKQNTNVSNKMEGRWREIMNWGVVTVHMMHLPVGDGQILFWDYGESNPDLGIYTTNNCKVWDFVTNTFTATPNTHNT